MSVFALRDINLTKIESRPSRSSPILHEMEHNRRSYNYVFFIDFIGSTAEVRPVENRESGPAAVAAFAVMVPVCLDAESTIPCVHLYF